LIVGNQTSETVAAVERIVHYIMNKKGGDIVTIDLRKVSSVADFFVIATGNSNVHAQAIADEVMVKLRKETQTVPWHVEGEEGQRWILIDYVDVVVHIFDSQTRAYYDIEGLYRDAVIRRIETNY